MRWALVFLFVSVLLSQVLAQDSTEDSPAPKRVLKKYRIRRPVVVDDQGNVVRSGPPRLRRVRVKQPRPTVETAALRANPPQTVSVSTSQSQSTQPIVLSTNPPRIRPTVAVAQPQPQPTQPTRLVQVQQQKQIRKPDLRPEPVFIEDVPQVIEQVRTVPTYRQATPSANRQALLANVNYKSRGASSSQVLDEEEDDQKVGTIRNYSHINEDGSFTFGYEAADGSFKEETRGIDCVVRGKYGYVDPDGVRREFEYVSGNPCDPNAPKEDEPESEEEDEREPIRKPLLRRIRPEINENNLQGLQQVREEALSDDQLNQYVRPVTRQRIARPLVNQSTPRPRIRITTAPPTLSPQTQSPALIIRERPVSVRPFVYQEPSQSLDSDRGGRLFNFDSEFHRISQISRPIDQPQPLYEQPLQVVQRHPTPTIATQPSRQVFGGSAAFRQFNSPNSLASPTAASPTTKTVTAGPPLAPGQKNPNFGRYRTELVYDPSNGQYTSVTVQAMPHSNQEIELTQKLRAFVEPQRPNQLNIQTFGQPQVQYFGTPQQQQHFQQQQHQQQQQQHQHHNRQQAEPQYTPASPAGQIDQFLARNAYSQQRQQVQQPQQQQQQPLNLQYFPQQTQQLRPNPSPSSAPLVQQPQHIQQSARQFQYPAASQSIDDSRNPANGQIDAFLRALNIDI